MKNLLIIAGSILLACTIMTGCDNTPNKQIVAEKIRALETQGLVLAWLGYAEDEVSQEIYAEIEKEQNKYEREKEMGLSFWGEEGFGAAIEWSNYNEKIEKLEEKKDTLLEKLRKRSREIDNIVRGLMKTWDYSYKPTREILHFELYTELSKSKNHEDSILVIKDFIANAVARIEMPDITELKKISEDHWVTKDLGYEADGETNEFVVRIYNDSIIVESYYPREEADNDSKQQINSEVLVYWKWISILLLQHL